MRLGFLARLIGGGGTPEAPVENLDDILSVSMQEPERGETYLDSTSIAATPALARERVLRNSHVFRDRWFALNEISPEQKAISSHFLRELSSLSRTRGIMLTPDVLDHLVSMLESGETALAYWQEPWMVPFKLTRRSAIDLFEMTVIQAAEKLPFQRLAESGLKHRMAKDYAELLDRLRADALIGSPLMKVFQKALSRQARVSGLEDLRSICNTLEYALACMGDRTSMLRVAEMLRLIAVPDCSVSVPSPADARRNELAVLSDAWRRMSSAIMAAPVGDGVSELPEFLATKRMDMRTLDAYFDSGSRWVLPPSNIPVIPAGPAVNDIMETFFTPFGAPAMQPSPPREDVQRDAMLKGLFEDEILRQILLESADVETRSNIADELLERLRRVMESGRAVSRYPVSALELTVAAFADLRQAHSIVIPTQPTSETKTTSLSSVLTQMTETAEVPAAASVASNPKHLIKVLDRIGESEESGRASASQTFGKLLELHELLISPRHADEVYLALNREFPWMTEANKYVARSVAYSAGTITKAFFAKPVLLCGSAGIGKTRWARRVSQIVGVPISITSMAGVSNTKSIVGSERGWVNARPSLPAYVFLATGVANPIVCIDEIDKTKGWEEITDAFLPMLEAETARNYSDVYLLGDLDVSRMNFIFTANDISRLSQPLLSRLRIVHTRAPNSAEIQPVLRQMVSEVCSECLIDDAVQKDIADSLVKRSSEIYLKCTNLRKVKEFIEEEIGAMVWSPPGPRLVS